MKKSIFFMAALALTFAACNTNEPEKAIQVADFENIELEEDTVLHLNATGTFESGNFVFTQEVADYGQAGVYYFGNVVSNKKGSTYDYYADSDKSAAGGAYAGKNFLVWTSSYTGADGIRLLEADVVPGMYVCNTAWVAEAIKNGDGMSTEEGGFTENDYLLLTITGTLNKVPTGTVEFYLAKGQNAVNQWTYVDLSTLGQIDQMQFALTSTKTNAYGMTTPAYFCIDNLGAKK